MTPRALSLPPLVAGLLVAAVAPPATAAARTSPPYKVDKALPARDGKRPRRPAPAAPQAPRFLGATNVGIEDCDTDNGTVSFEVGWWPAIDDDTDPDDMVYDIFQSRRPGEEDFSHPTYTSEPGALTVVTPELPVGTYYYVVRARDAAGNTDTNVVEVSGSACEDDTAPDDDE